MSMQPKPQNPYLEMKVIEIRDEGTCIPAIAIRMVSLDTITRHYLKRSGYPDGHDRPASIMLMRIHDGKATNDPYEWPDLTGDRRTMPTAHKWIIENWDELEHGQVVDVEFILGIASEPKIAERLTVFGYQE